MAIIYGIADSERSLLDKPPKEVQNIDDMDRVRKEFYGKMQKQRRGKKAWNSFFRSQKISLQKTS